MTPAESPEDRAAFLTSASEVLRVPGQQLARIQDELEHAAAEPDDHKRELRVAVLYGRLRGVEESVASALHFLGELVEPAS